MDLAIISVVALVGLAAVFDYTNGFHDSANSVATVVATGVLSPRRAVLWAAFWNFIAFTVFGTAVANTVAATVKEPYVGLAVIFAALVGALVWNFVSWHLGLPTSSSHALVGGLVGAGLAHGGWSAISSANVRRTLLFLVASPMLGMLLAVCLMGLLRLSLARRDAPRAARHFRRAQLLSSAAVSLGHGGNDAQKTMGVIAALLVATGHLTATGDKISIPLWVVLLAHASIAAGTYAGGWRIVRTMGMKITKLGSVSGFAAETSAAIALFTSTFLGAPVSTTHTVAGAITGVGIANRGTTVDWTVFGQVALAWVVTIPVAAGVAACSYAIIVIPPPWAAVVGMTIVLGVLAAFVIWSLRQAPNADDIAADLQTEGPSGAALPL